MKSFTRVAGLTLAIAASTAAHASQDSTAPAANATPIAGKAAPIGSIKEGVILRTSDGRSLGRIGRVYESADGKPQRVSVIVGSQFVYIPASTISAAEKGYVTSLTKADVRKLQ